MTFPLSIYSLDREIFLGQANSVTLPGSEGQLQVLAHHAPFISLLREGDMVLEDENGFRKNIPIAGGVVEVKQTQVVVLVDF
ncbi:MAG: hypothetical protein HYS60_00095 [Candidatus Wildermuthbacteria bacterium]|nr:hypothetical protein [Candidatus Wildermuthbacteria bacterium]